jgi:DNA polymerase I-like protein with 3'-5' exonuclease and polymerase domains/uracil-DNA glycosylase
MSYEAGWLSGFIDGEGHLTGSKRNKTNRAKLIAGFSQNVGPVLARAERAVSSLGFSLRAKEESRKNGVVCARRHIAGGFNASLRFLGVTRPTRLLNDLVRMLGSRPPEARLSESEVLSKDTHGAREVVDIQTTAGTFIANGFVVHNCGASGVELDQSLAQGGLARNDCTITNTILCQPPEDFDDYLEKLTRAHKKACEDAEKRGLPPPERKISPLEACAPRLLYEMNVSASKTVLAVGGKALRAMAHHYGVSYGLNVRSTRGNTVLSTIKGQHGSPAVMPDGTILASSLHPAFAMRNNRQYTQVVRDNIARAAHIAKRGNKIDWHEPNFAYFEKWPEDDETRVRIIEEHSAWFVANAGVARLTVDIETDSIGVRCLIRVVGMGMTVSSLIGQQERVISAPLLWRSGREFWRNRSHRTRVEDAIRRAIDTCHLTFHNGLFDTGVLLRLGLMTDVSKIWFDTMVGQKNTDSNDLPHDLGFCARQFTEAPLWKHDVDHKADENTEKDSDLHLYNSKDVLITMRIQPIIENRIVECGNVPQFRLDSNLAPIARDMGRLGLFIDEKERGDLSLKFNKITRGLTDKIRTIVARNDFNPRSPPQVKDFLYGQKGYAPPLNTEGYEWEPGDDASSSTPSLMKLLDFGVDDQAEQFINAELEFRACDKLRGSYIDNLKVHYDWTVMHDETITWKGDVKAMRAFLACLGQLDPVIIDNAEILPARPEISWMPVTWKIHVIPGGRWVCEPTIQNWPSRGWTVDGKPTNMRKMIIAPPGHVIVGADYEQIELRIYGVVADDQYVLRSFKETLVVNGKDHSDPHCLNAATIMAEHESDIMPLYGEFMRKHFYGTKDEKSEMKYIRTVAKRVCYLKNYGGEEDKLFSAMSSERDKATGKRVFPNLQPSRVAEWEERWEKRHPETKRWHRRVHDFVRRNGYAMTPIMSQRKRFFVGGPNKKNAPPNHEIQGAAGEIKNEAILRLHEEIPFGKWSRYTGLCMDIHDYLAAFVPEERADETIKIFNKCMRTEMTCADGWKMPIFAEAKASRNLADNA